MVLSETTVDSNITTSASKKRRLRRKRLLAARATLKPTNKLTKLKTHETTTDLNGIIEVLTELSSVSLDDIKKNTHIGSNIIVQKVVEMSSNEAAKSRDDVLAAREAKKLAKQKGKVKGGNQNEVKEGPPKETKNNAPSEKTDAIKNVAKENKGTPIQETSPSKSKDEVDRAVVQAEQIIEGLDKSKDDVKAERAAKKAAKQAKKKKEGDGGDVKAESDMTVKDVVETLKDIANVAREVQDVTAKVQAINLEPKRTGESSKNKPQSDEGKEESGKSKAELRAERRAKQEAQRAAKQATVQQKVAATPEAKPKAEESVKAKEERPPKAKSVEKTKTKPQRTRLNWFQHLHMQQDKEALKKIPVNSANLHPAIVKLGVQLASRVVAGSNARCIALLDALKKMVRDYTLPAKTEFARGLEAHLATSLDFLWSMRQPSASQTNAIKFFRHQLTQLPNTVAEFDAKKTLQEEIDRYIREQIDMAGEAISIAVRNKICDGDTILTYGSSSLIWRIVREAWAAGVAFRVVAAGARAGAAATRHAPRSPRAPVTYIDITAVSFVMNTIDKVLVGASALLVNGSVLGAAGTAQVALVARAYNVPVLVACETHKFSERVQTDAFVYNEIGDPDELIDKTDENSPLKDWRSNPNLTPLNLTYDVTPPSLVTAVVTELAILPCTSAPVVLRFKLSEYGIQG